MAKGIQMDIIGSVPIDLQAQIQVFAQAKKDPIAALESNRRRMQNMSVLERKEKLLDILNKQRMKASTNNLLQTERDEINSNGIQSPYYNKNEPYTSFKLPDTYRSSNLPPLGKANKGQQQPHPYYLAHSLDLSQPAIMRVPIQNLDTIAETLASNNKHRKNAILHLDSPKQYT